jgi:hypothetical protein
MVRTILPAEPRTGGSPSKSPDRQHLADSRITLEQIAGEVLAGTLFVYFPRNADILFPMHAFSTPSSNAVAPGSEPSDRSNPE